MANNAVTVVSGPNRMSSASLVGKTVADIRDEMAEALDLTGGETAQITRGNETNPADDDDVLESGDRLVFSLVAGVKGVR